LFCTSRNCIIYWSHCSVSKRHDSWNQTELTITYLHLTIWHTLRTSA
jgi:hypothetical protein